MGNQGIRRTVAAGSGALFPVGFGAAGVVFFHPAVAGQTAVVHIGDVARCAGVDDVVCGAGDVAAGHDAAVFVVEPIGLQCYVTAGHDAGGIGLRNLGFIDLTGVVVFVVDIIGAVGRAQVAGLVVADEADFVSFIAIVRSVAPEFAYSLLVNQYFFGLQMLISIADVLHGQIQVAHGFDGGAGICQGFGPAGGVLAVIQRPADRHVAAAVNQGMFAVVDGGGADVQLFPGSNHRGSGAIANIVYGCCANGDLIAVNPAAVAV